MGGWECSSAGRVFSSTHKALGLITSTAQIWTGTKSAHNFMMVEKYLLWEDWLREGSTVRKFIPLHGPWLWVKYTEEDLWKRFGNNSQGWAPMGLSIPLALSLYERRKEIYFQRSDLCWYNVFIDCYFKLWLLYFCSLWPIFNEYTLKNIFAIL